MATDLTKYNLWANQQFINWLSQKPEAQLHTKVASSFSGILKTLNHIWAIEEYWFSIITKTPDFVNRYFVEELIPDEIFKGLSNRSQALVSAVENMSEEQINERIKVTSPWFEAELSVYEYLQHLLNHSTYHRGQIVTIGHNAGITDAPGSDMLFFKIAGMHV